MNRMLLLLCVSFAGVAVGAIGATYVSAQGTPQITRSEILRKPMSGLEGKEVVVFLADVPPGGVAALHAWRQVQRPAVRTGYELVVEEHHG